MATKAEAIIGMVERGEKWKPVSWIENYYIIYDNSESCCGFFNDRNRCINISELGNNWKLYKEPKVLYQWLLRNTLNDMYKPTVSFYSNIAEIKVPPIFEIVCRLDHTKVEL